MVGECFEIAGFTFPDQGQFISSPGLQVPVNGIGDNIYFTAGEPFIKGLFRIVKDFVPFLKPLQLFSLFSPELFPVFDRIVIEFVVFLDIRMMNYP